jgi:hypothetical protein
MRQRERRLKFKQIIEENKKKYEETKKNGEFQD